MHIILTGATGLVGSAVLVALRARPDVSRISILSRRPVPMLEGTNDSRIEVIIHDFKGYDCYPGTSTERECVCVGIGH
ncbi:Bcboa16 [Botrytis cinerea B05.10]|uniref:Bcboa16 n=1 Tax=Botryotinia fuckeliana (strain B05.10) TaxID=332648 RepID=A0A384J3V0_BOTFB|nr:Bcboa16 [Botrytis cinerea B05.10]ATZ45193.1 Bcboa16 [Botrytis cinerea B05.10]